MVRRHYCSYSIVLALIVLTNVRPAVQLSAAHTPVLHIDAPRQVEVGQPIMIMLTLQNAVEITGYETTMHFNTAIAHVSIFHQQMEALGTLRGSVEPLGLVEMPHGVAFGAFTCTDDICVNDQRGPQRDQGSSDTFTLATLAIVVDQPGTLEIKLDRTVFVDGANRQLQVARSNPMLAVQVGSSHASPRYRAPAINTTRPTATSPAPTPLGPFNLTRGSRTTHAHVMEAALSWTLARERGTPCNTLSDRQHDLNADGCIDVADLQLFATTPYIRSTNEDVMTVSSARVKEAPTPAGLTFIVNTVADDDDANSGDGICVTSAGMCTLRAAISEANRQAGPNIITFNIPGDGIHTIQLTGQLPTLHDETGPTAIDGYTQPGAAPNTEALVSKALIKVQLEGKGEANFIGLSVTSSGNLIRGLACFKLKHAIIVYGSSARDNVIIGNFIGTDATGTYFSSTYEHLASGVVLEQGAAHNRIGGSGAAERNVISGNAFHGVALYHAGTNNNVIQGNIIGLGPEGNTRVHNYRHGIDINFGASENLVGGSGRGEQNVISGNGWSGVELSHGQDTTRNQVIGNFIGTDVSGRQATLYSYNKNMGIYLEDGVTNNVVASNIIGNNQAGGIGIDGYFTRGNHLFDNRIGISLDGSAIPNGKFGVQVNNQATQSLIGPNNIIANNPVGVEILNQESDFNTITRNAIFANTKLGIDLDPGGVNINDQYTHDGPNQRLNFPVFMSATPLQITGTACMTCTVELFRADRRADQHGQGKTFLSSATVRSDGTFIARLSGVEVGDYVTATATDATGNTSEFSHTQPVGVYVYLPLMVR